MKIFKSSSFLIYIYILKDNHGFMTNVGVLYIELAISFLIGRKCTANFQISARDVITVDYTIIMSRTLKVTGNHVMYDRGA